MRGAYDLAVPTTAPQRQRQPTREQQWRKITYGMANGPVDLTRQRAFQATRPIPREYTVAAIVKRENQERKAACRREPQPMTASLATDVARREQTERETSPIGGRAKRPRPPPQAHDEPLKNYLRQARRHVPQVADEEGGGGGGSVRSPPTSPMQAPSCLEESPRTGSPRASGKPYAAAPFADPNRPRQQRRVTLTGAPIGADERNPANDPFANGDIDRKTMAALAPIQAGRAQSASSRRGSASASPGRSHSLGRRRTGSVDAVSPGRSQSIDSIPDMRRYFTQREIAVIRSRLEREIAQAEREARSATGAQMLHEREAEVSDAARQLAADAAKADAACEDQAVVRAFRHLLLSHTAYRVPTAADFYDRIRAWREGRSKASPQEILKKYRNDAAGSAKVIEDYLLKLYLASGRAMRVQKKLQVDEALLDTFVGNPAAPEKHTFPVGTPVLYSAPAYPAEVVHYTSHGEVLVDVAHGTAQRRVAHKELRPAAGFQSGDRVTVLGRPGVVTGSARGRVGVRVTDITGGGDEARISVMAWEVTARGPFAAGDAVIVTPLPTAGVVAGAKHRGRVGVKMLGGAHVGCLTSHLKQTAPVEDAPGLWALATSAPGMEGLRMLAHARSEEENVHREEARNEKIAEKDIPLSVVPGWVVVSDKHDASAVTIAIAGTQNPNDCFRDALFIPEQLTLPHIPPETRKRVDLARPHAPIPEEFEGAFAHMGFADGATQLFKDIVPVLVDLLQAVRVAAAESPVPETPPPPQPQAVAEAPGGEGAAGGGGGDGDGDTAAAAAAAAVESSNGGASNNKNPNSRPGTPPQPALRITVTGHSLGGATSMLLAAYLRASQIDGINVEEVYTFGAPNVFNLKHWDEQQLPALRGLNMVQLVNEADLVPRALGSKAVRKLAKLAIKKGGIEALRCVTEDNAEDLTNYKYTSELLYYLNGKGACEVVHDRQAQATLLQLGMLGLRPKAAMDHKISSYIANLLPVYNKVTEFTHAYEIQAPSGKAAASDHPILIAAFDKKDPTRLSKSFREAAKDIYDRVDGVTPGVLSALASLSQKLLPAHYLQGKVFGGQYELVDPPADVAAAAAALKSPPSRAISDDEDGTDPEATPNEEELEAAMTAAQAAAEQRVVLNLDVTLSADGWLAYIEDACYNDLAWVARLFKSMGWIHCSAKDDHVKKQGPHAKLKRADITRDPKGASDVVHAPRLLVPRNPAVAAAAKKKRAAPPVRQLTNIARDVCDQIYDHYARQGAKAKKELPNNVFTQRRRSLRRTSSSAHTPDAAGGREAKIRRMCFTADPLMRAESVKAFARAWVQSGAKGNLRRAISSPPTSGEFGAADAGDLPAPHAAAAALHTELTKPDGCDGDAVYEIVATIADEAGWKAVVADFAAAYPTCHEGSLATALQEELTATELVKCEGVLTERDIDVSALARTTHEQAVVAALISQIYDTLQPIPGSIQPGTRHITKAGFEALFALWVDDDELRVRAALNFGGGYSTALTECTTEEFGAPRPLWDVGRLDAACAKADRAFLKALEEHEQRMEVALRQRIYEIWANKTPQETALSPARDGLASARSGASSLGGIQLSSMRSPFGGTSGGARPPAAGGASPGRKRKEPQQRGRGAPASQPGRAASEAQRRAQVQARIYDVSRDMLGPQYNPRVPYSQQAKRGKKTTGNVRGDTITMYLAPLPPQQINRVKTDGTKETVTLKKHVFGNAAADPRCHKVSSNNHPSMPYGHLVKYAKHGALPSIPGGEAHRRQITSAPCPDTVPALALLPKHQQVTAPAAGRRQRSLTERNAFFVYKHAYES